MSDDERMARELQRQFDAEERRRQAQEAASERLAQRLAASSHSMSDSDVSDSPRYSMSEDSDAEGAARRTETAGDRGGAVRDASDRGERDGSVRGGSGCGERGGSGRGEQVGSRRGEQGGSRRGEQGGSGRGERGEQGGSRLGERGGSRLGERGGSRLGERGGSRLGERGGSRLGERGGSERGERGGSRLGERGGSRLGERGGSERGERGGSRLGERGGSRLGERGGSERGERGGSRLGERGGSERGERGGSERGERVGSGRGERGPAARKRRHSPPAAGGGPARDGVPCEDGGAPPGGKRRRLPPTGSGAGLSSPARNGRGPPVTAARTTHRTQTVPAAEAREVSRRPDTVIPAASAGVVASGGSDRPVPQRECRYGARCFRLGNPAHTQAFSHPEQSADPTQPPGDAAQVSSGTENGSPAQKKRPGPKTSIADRLREAEPISFFLTKVRSVKSTWRERLSLGIVELLDPSLGELRSSLQLNFLVDMDWLLDAYSVYGHQHKPLTVLHGIDPFSSPQSHITVQKVSMPYPFGTHHTKMMLFEYAEGLRVVIHTANLVDDDWRDKTQGLWVSPLLPPLSGDAAVAAGGEAPTGFRADLTRYLSAYKLSCLTPWLERIARHDFSAVRVFFVSSVPGRFQGAEMARWGHFRVRRLLQTHAVRRSWDLVIQCSSIGRLGNIPEQWLLGEFRESLTGGTSSARAAVLYPTEENVRTSVEGYDGGSCLPYHHKTHVQQLWLQEYLHQWRSESRCRSGAMPHIKTYAQLSGDRQRLAWFMLTSANLSKAAWGATEKQGQQLFIRSYEAGVLYVPKLLDCESLPVLTGDTAVPGCISLPYSVPLVPYGDGDKPWFSDTAHPRPDPMGRMLVKK